MKIIDFRIYVVGVPNSNDNWLFLKLMTDEGGAGFGECSWHSGWYGIGGRASVYAENIKQIIKQFVIGKSPFNVEKLWWDYYLSGHASRHSGPISTPSFTAIEIACWDIIGKATNQPIYNLLGGKVRDKLRSYSYLRGPHRGVDAELIAQNAAAMMESGFTGIKVDPVGDVRGEDILERLDEVEAIIKAIREAVGRNCDIMLGTHGQFDTATAIRFAKRLEPYDLAWFEEPVQPENVAELARVAQATSIPIASGERLLTKFEFVPLLEKKATAILQLDTSSCGGILEAKKIAAMADCHYAQIAPHMYGGPLSLAASMQVDMCCTNFYIQECNTSEFHNAILKEPICWENGYLVPSERPGLGLELNEEILAEFPAHSG
jgi:galactonate dehydratase